MNSLGSIFKVTSFGESHSAMVGCVVEGVPAGLVLDIEKIQQAVDKRKTNQTNFSSTRNEEDVVEMVSGVFEQKTLGTPICILIKNKDARSQDYDSLKQVYRPSHADYTYEQKYGFRDHRGGGRSSFRITAPLVAAGEIAHQFIQHYFSIEVNAYVSQIGTVALPENETLHWSDIEKNEFRCPHAATALKMQALVEETRLAGDTLGGVISCQIKNMPVGIGEPIFGKLNAQLAQAMMSINTVKGFEYGDGFANAALKGSESNDLFEFVDGKMKTKSNHSGGIQGGISNGEDVFFRVAFKPISSIQKPQETLDQANEKQTVHINGRHDVCAVPRAVPVVIAYANMVLADLLLHSKIKKS